jgi:hypothetical protein
MLPRTRRGIWLRNPSMRMMTRRPVRGLVAGLFHKADAIVLEDYLPEHPSSGPIPPRHGQECREIPDYSKSERH